jgi:hypothetical protein
MTIPTQATDWKNHQCRPIEQASATTTAYFGSRDNTHANLGPTGALSNPGHTSGRQENGQNYALGWYRSCSQQHSSRQYNKGVIMRNETYGEPEGTGEDLSRPRCDECDSQYATTRWHGRFLCPQCLEEELENDHTLPKADR